MTECCTCAGVVIAVLHYYFGSHSHCDGDPLISAFGEVTDGSVLDRIGRRHREMVVAGKIHLLQLTS